jgi:hypothetical protein
MSRVDMLSGKKSVNVQWSEGPSVFGGPVRPHPPHPLRAGPDVHVRIRMISPVDVVVDLFSSSW